MLTLITLLKYFLHYEVTLFLPSSFFHTLLFEREAHICYPDLRTGQLFFTFLRAEYSHNYLESFCVEQFSFLLYLYRVSIFYQYKLMNIYFIFWVIKQYILFCAYNLIQCFLAQSFLGIGLGVASSIAFCVPVICPWFIFKYLLSGKVRSLALSCIFHTAVLESTNSLRILVAFIGESY